MRFLSNLVASTIGALIALGIIFFFGFAFIVALSFSDTTPRVRSNSVLKMHLSGPISESQEDNSLATAFGKAPKPNVLQVLNAIESAKSDTKIEGLWLQPEFIGASWANMEEIRKALIGFKESGKPFYASGGTNGFSEKDYYLASVADSVFSPPESYFELNGFYLASEFYKDALEKFDVTPEVIRSGKFKSAVEPYLRNDLSPENKLQLTALVENINHIFMTGLSESREIPVAKLENLAGEKGMYTAHDAFNEGLIDGLWYERQVEELFKERIFEGKDARWTGLNTYIQTLVGNDYLATGGINEVAIVYAAGQIQPGSSGNNPNPLTGGSEILGSDTFIRTMRKVREDESVKSVVLRIDSPGGSASAGDEMWDAVFETQKVKPVIVSMGGLAASGGYYIAAPAEYIVAAPSTITGSIGVFAMMLNPVDFFENKIGIHFDVVKTGPYADMFGMTRKLSDRDKDIIGRSVDQTYDTFINKVADGRDMTPSQVDEIAQGRVWSGTDALKVGLVDSLGSLEDAVLIAAERAEIVEEGYSISVHPKPRPLFEQLSDTFSIKALSGLFKSEFSEQEKLLLNYREKIANILNQNGMVQTALPFNFVIE